MTRVYTDSDCWNKANQHWEMAGLARQDGDRDDERRHTDLARLWEQRFRDGGYVDE